MVSHAFRFTRSPLAATVAWGQPGRLSIDLLSVSINADVIPQFIALLSSGFLNSVTRHGGARKAQLGPASLITGSSSDRGNRVVSGRHVLKSASVVSGTASVSNDGIVWGT